MWRANSFENISLVWWNLDRVIEFFASFWLNIVKIYPLLVNMVIEVSLWILYFLRNIILDNSHKSAFVISCWCLEYWVYGSLKRHFPMQVYGVVSWCILLIVGCSKKTQQDLEKSNFHRDSIRLQRFSNFKQIVYYKK